MSLTNRVETCSVYNDVEDDRLSTSALCAQSETNDECDLLIGKTDQHTHVSSRKTSADMAECHNYHYSSTHKRGNKNYFINNIISYLNLTNQLTPTPTSTASTTTHPHTAKLGAGKHQADARQISSDYIEDEEHFNIRDYKKHSTNTDWRHAEESHRRRGVSAAGRTKKIRLFIFICITLVLIVFSLALLLELSTLIENYKLVIYHSLTNDRREQQKNQQKSNVTTNGQVDNDQLEAGKASRWLVSSPKCHIPAIDPWHKSIESFVRIKPQVDCKKLMVENQTSLETLTFVDNNRLFLTDRAVQMGAFIHCCLRQVTRAIDNDDELEKNETCHPIYANGLWAPFELVRVECPRLNYTNVHSFIAHHFDEEAALNRIAAKHLDEDKYYNVIMVGIDTISRLNGLRQLNRTLALLKEQYETIEFYGYNKVGENTFPNLIPLLSGLTPEQLTETQCWLATNYSQESESGDDYLDNCKFLWNYYQEIGYNTFFSEDWAKASTFNYLKQGFKYAPTVYYGRPYTIEREKLLLPQVNMGCTLCQLDRPTVEIDLDNLKQFIGQQYKKPFFGMTWINCPPHDDLNGASQVDLIIEKFFKDVFELTRNDRTFVLFFSDHGYRWDDFVSTRVGHYESSLPLLTIAPPKKFILEHPDLVRNMKKHQASLLTPFDMFKTLVDIRNLGKKSATANHASRWRFGRNNRHKRAAITRYNHSSRSGRRKLSTTRFEDSIFYSIPTASTTVMQLKLLTGETYEQKFKTFSILQNHNSSELDRSCAEAGIPDNYCVCHEFEKVKTTDLDVLGAAYYLVYAHLYDRLRNNERICHPLDLETVHDAQLYDFKQMKSVSTLKPNVRRKRKSDTTVKLDEDENWPPKRVTTPKPQRLVTTEFLIDEHQYLPNREYNIRVSTKPGGALFQEVVRFYGKSIRKCRKAVNKIKNTLEYNSTSMNSLMKSNLVSEMNQICRYSVHSDSISRLNLYKDQSKCVKSNIELKKICYCNDLL